MGNASQSFYEILGIDRAADERAVKKAYFALVRKFPPETHPEEFKRIREAYEVLANPQSRADYDAVNQFDQYGAEVSAHLKAGTEAMEQADWPRAQSELIAVLEQQPQLHFARDLLGMAYLNAHRPADAMREFTRLVAEQPANAVYHLHKGYAHYAQNQYAPALDCYREARTLDPSDTRSLVATADCLVAQKQYEPALLELDRAIGLDGQVDFNDFVFFMRKVQIQLLRDRGDLAETELDQIFKILPEDPETKKYVATRLASLASDLFAMKRSADANRLLVRCKKLDPSRKSMEYTFPARTKLRIEALPETSRAWLAKHATEWSAGKLKHNAKAGPVLLLLLAIGVEIAALNAGFNTRRAWDSGQRLGMFLLLVGAPMLLALSIRLMVRVSRSPYGKYTTLHPCHLLQVEVDKLTVWPLVNLHDVSLTHHSTNGVYSHTICRLNFAGTVCNITIRGQQASVDWANLVLAQRRKVLDLMGMGLLEAEEGFDLIPPSLLLPGKAGPAAPKDKSTIKWYGGAAAVGAAMFAVAIPMNLGAAERFAWTSASRYPNLTAYRDYVEAFPSGAHVGEAKLHIEESYERAIAQYGERAGTTSAGAKAIVAVLQALESSGAKAVNVTYDSAIDFSAVKAFPEKGIIDADPAFTPTENKSRERAITAALRDAFGNVVGNDVIDFDDGAYSYSYDYVNHRTRERKKGPITFAIHYRVGPSGTIYESTTGTSRKFYGILFDWSLVISDGKGGELYKTQLSSAPAKNIRYTTSGYVQSDILPYTKMAESAFGELGRKLAGDFGISIAKPADADFGNAPSSPPRLGGPGLTPEMQKILDDMARSGKMSEETRRLLLDAQRRRKSAAEGSSN
jgi:curved DNA-binding protein CbpA